MKQIYIITYENSHWCGGELHCLVEAESADNAEMLASDYMQETQQELFSDEYEEESFEDCAYSVNDTEVLAGSSFEKYVADPGQQSIYPKVNF